MVIIGCAAVAATEYEGAVAFGGAAMEFLSA